MEYKREYSKKLHINDVWLITHFLLEPHDKLKLTGILEMTGSHKNKQPKPVASSQSSGSNSS